MSVRSFNNPNEPMSLKKEVDSSSNGGFSFSELYGQTFIHQQAEWLRKRPINYDQWFIVPSPKGIRCLAVACCGQTDLYDRKGNWLKKFESVLPGGGKTTSYSRKAGVTMLDVIYIPDVEIIQVMDCLVYDSMMIDFYTAQARLAFCQERIQKAVAKGKEQNVKILPPNFFKFSNELEMINCLMKYPFWENNQPELDGFLFIHRGSTYSYGPSDYIRWLYPYMIEEIFGFPIHERYKGSKPPNYVNAYQYMDQFDEVIIQKKQILNWDPLDFDTDHNYLVLTDDYEFEYCMSEVLA